MLLVELRSGTGEVIGRGGESAGAVPILLPDFEDDEFPMLKYVDRYGDTVFNRLQMEAVIPELRRLKELAKTEQQAAMIDTILKLAEQCEADVHLYLVFVGD